MFFAIRMKCSLNLIPNYIFECDLVTIANHLNMHDLKYNLLKLVSFEASLLDKCNIAWLERLILFLYLNPFKLLNEVGLETYLSESAWPSFLSSLLKKELLDLDFLKLVRENLLVENMHWGIRSGR
jgi:hypothetical protein